MEDQPINPRIKPIQSCSLDLESYISGYRGRTKITRLLHIASNCPPLSINAYHAAIAFILSDSLDITLYNDTLSQLNTLLCLRNLPTVDPNHEWIEKSQQTIQAESSRLDAELRTYKYNAIKDSIRMGYNDMAEHYTRCGDISNATKCFIKARDHSTSPKNSVYHTINLINSYLILNQMQSVQINLRRLVSETKTKKTAIVSTLKHIFQALVYLNEQAYKKVADTLQKLQLSDTKGHIEEIMSVNDVAIICGVCALATYSRNELKHLIESQSFRLFLDLEPIIKESISAFVGARYAKSLQLLNEHMNNRLLDIYLWQHVDCLFNKTRQLAMVQYCSPYSTVDLTRMADFFGNSVVDLEREMAGLIIAGPLDMTINSRDKLLVRKAVDERALTFTNVLATGASLELSHQQALLKMALIQDRLAVHNSIQQQQHSGPMFINPDGGLIESMDGRW